jgi:hypothetical protein
MQCRIVTSYAAQRSVLLLRDEIISRVLFDSGAQHFAFAFGFWAILACWMLDAGCETCETW